MKDYVIVKNVYVERYKRIMTPGKIVPFDDAAALILIEKGIIRPAEPVELQNYQRRGGRKRDRELDKLPETL